MKVHAALIIHCVAIHGLDYSRTRKRVKTTNYEGENTVLTLIDGFGIRGFKISQDRNPCKYRGKPVKLK